MISWIVPQRGVVMERWIAGLLSLALTLGMTAGCQQKCFIAEKDYYDKHLLPAGLEDYGSALVQSSNVLSPAPPSVDQPDRPPRHLSLQEALAISLENGATG